MFFLILSSIWLLYTTHLIFKWSHLPKKNGAEQSSFAQCMILPIFVLTFSHCFVLKSEKRWNLKKLHFLPQSQFFYFLYNKIFPRLEFGPCPLKLVNVLLIGFEMRPKLRKSNNVLKALVLMLASRL